MMHLDYRSFETKERDKQKLTIYDIDDQALLTAYHASLQQPISLCAFCAFHKSPIPWEMKRFLSPSFCNHLRKPLKQGSQMRWPQERIAGRVSVLDSFVSQQTQHPSVTMPKRSADAFKLMWLLCLHIGHVFFFWGVFPLLSLLTTVDFFFFIEYCTRELRFLLDCSSSMYKAIMFSRVKGIALKCFKTLL